MRIALVQAVLLAGCIVEPRPPTTLFSCEDAHLTDIRSMAGRWQTYRPEDMGSLRWPVTSATCSDGLLRIAFRPAPEERATLELYLVNDPPYQHLNEDHDLDDPNSFRLTFDRFEVDGRARDPYKVSSHVELKSLSVDGPDLRIRIWAYLECTRCGTVDLSFRPSAVA